MAFPHIGARALVAHQPAYLPWCGYVSRLLNPGPDTPLRPGGHVDELVILDHVQFAERGRQHRNFIRTRDGAVRLTVPVQRRFGQALHTVRIAEQPWAARHWRAITESYRKAPYWSRHAEELGALYARPWTYLTDLDIALTRWLLDALGLTEVKLLRTTAIAPAGNKTRMLIDLCLRTDNRILRVGTGAPAYLDFAALAEAGISVEVARHAVPRSSHPPLAALDLLMHHGPASLDLLARASTIRALRPGLQT